jgi:hypothetical protein
MRPSANKAAPIVSSTSVYELEAEWRATNLADGFYFVHYEYEAVSYTWGDSGDIRPVPIIFNDNHSYMTMNLKAILRVLRLPFHQRVLSIDVLCIYLDRPQAKHCGTPRFCPRFYEGVR